MKNRSSDDDFKGVSALIQKDEEDALAFFRARIFRGRLESRLESAAGTRKRTFCSPARAVPVLATVLVAIAAGTYFLLTKRPAPEPAPEFQALSSALAQLPGFSQSPGLERTAPVSQTGISRMAESIRLVLVSAEKTKIEEEQEMSVPATGGQIPRLSPDQRIEILFKDKAIERAFILHQGDSKEV